MKDNQFFNLNSFCYLIKGAKKGCLYDFLNGNVYSVDEKLVQILNQENLSMEEIAEKAGKASILRNKIYKNLEKLVSLGLGKFTEKKIFIDRVHFDFKENIIKRGQVVLSRILVRITSECSLNCIFCNEKTNAICFPCSRISSNSTESITTSKLQRNLYDASLFNCEELKLTGGDPLLVWPSLLEVISYAREYFGNIEIFSNLSSISKEQIRTLSKFNTIKIVFPIFGDENFHDLITGGKGNFKRSIENVLNLTEAGVKVRALVVKTKNDKCKNLLNFLRSKKIPFQLVSALSLKQESYLSNYFNDFHIRSDMFEKIDIYRFFYRKSYNSCWGQQLLIDINGNVKPCLFAKHTLGNILNDSLKTILREGRQDKYWNLTKDSIDTCKDCEFRYCCPLDCRVASESLYGSLNSKCSFCDYDPYKGKWNIQKEDKGGI